MTSRTAADINHPLQCAAAHCVKEGATDMKNFRCGDVIPGCTRQFTGTTEDILVQVAQHAYADHGMADISPAILAQVQSSLTPAI